MITLSSFAIYFAIKYTGKAKSTDEVRSIWQLAITAIAGSVGIGTIINTTRTASMSSESMRVTKEKEIREQSPHLIALSESLKIPLTAPMYKEFLQDEYPDTTYLNKHTKDFYKHLNEVREKNKNNPSILLNRNMEALEEYEKSVELFSAYMNKVISNKIKFRDAEHFISVVNSGKGTAVNIEYEFIFENYKKFSGYQFSSILKHPAYKDIPKYSISVEEIKQNGMTPYFKMVDGHLTNDVSRLSAYRGADEAYYPIGDDHTIYLNVISSGESHNFPVPIAFSVLAKHYMICKYFKEEYTLVFSDFSKETIETYINAKPIMPEGKIIIRYTDDEVARTNPNKKNKIELIYKVQLKETTLDFFENVISNVYLEVSYVSSKTS